MTTTAPAHPEAPPPLAAVPVGLSCSRVEAVTLIPAVLLPNEA